MALLEIQKCYVDGKKCTCGAMDVVGDCPRDGFIHEDEEGYDHEDDEFYEDHGADSDE